MLHLLIFYATTEEIAMQCFFLCFDSILVAALQEHGIPGNERASNASKHGILG
jgi:hypothetical protein